MIFKETPMVKDIERRLQFETIEWLDKETFEKKLANNECIYPFVLDNSKTQPIYIGKLIKYQKSQSNLLKNLLEIEQIGQVCKDHEQQWSLYISCKYNINKDFLILSVKCPDSYCWLDADSLRIPKYTFIAALDEQTSDFLYIGRTMKGTQDDTHLNNFIGKVRAKDQKLHILMNNNHEVSLKKFQIFCLKPSPKPLKDLCRIEIRKYTQHSNLNMVALKLPNILTNFIKYPSSLRMGEYLLKGEKLCTDDCKYELYIDIDNYLVCANATNNSKLLLYKQNIDTIWLQRSQTLFFYSKTYKIYLGCLFYEIPNVYEFKMFNNKEHPKFIFDYPATNSTETNKKSSATSHRFQILYNYFSNYDEIYMKYFSNNGKQIGT